MERGTQEEKWLGEEAAGRSTPGAADALISDEMGAAGPMGTQLGYSSGCLRHCGRRLLSKEQLLSSSWDARDIMCFDNVFMVGFKHE